MPKLINKWICTVCSTEYDTEKRAQACQDTGLPPETSNIKVGDTIKFTRNIADEIGSIQTFVSGEGEVLHIVTTRNDKTNKHQSIFIVHCQDELGVYEGVCSMLNVNGIPEMFLAANPRYQIGFAKSLQEGDKNG